MALRHLIIAITLAVIMPLASAFAAPEIYTGRFSNTALQGYDTVAYFTEGRPVQGSSDFTTEYKGVVWKFSSQANLDLFLADPEAYTPQYGGYCAWAVAKGQLAKGSAQQWYIEDGKLYLNLNRNIKSRWIEDREALIEDADANWPTVLD